MNEEEQIDVKLEPFSEKIADDLKLTELYQKLWMTALDFSEMGHNTLGDIGRKNFRQRYDLWYPSSVGNEFLTLLLAKFV